MRVVSLAVAAVIIALGSAALTAAEPIIGKQIEFTAVSSDRVIEVRSADLVLMYDKEQHCFSDAGGKVGFVARLGGTISMEVRCEQSPGTVTATASAKAHYVGDTLTFEAQMEGRGNSGEFFRQSFVFTIEIAGRSCSGTMVVRFGGRTIRDTLSNCRVSSL